MLAQVRGTVGDIGDAEYCMREAVRREPDDYSSWKLLAQVMRPLDGLSADLRHRMISEAAYHLYTQRGYREGYDLDDWLEAEAQVDHVLVQPPESAGEPG